MKRRELEKKLRHAGCYLKREGGSHSLWIILALAWSKRFPAIPKSKSRWHGRS
jgi:hypothetical protein